jgi:hypothetical protein
VCQIVVMVLHDLLLHSFILHNFIYSQVIGIRPLQCQLFTADKNSTTFLLVQEIWLQRNVWL